MKLTNKITIGEIVADDFRTAAIFTKYHIDFCCKGYRTIEEVCKKRDIEQNELIEHIEKARNSSANQSFDYKSWPADMIADYITKTHHRYIEEKAPIIIQYLTKLCGVHGAIHPELHEIHTIFSKSALDLTAHMKREELVVFPFIKKMKAAQNKGTSFDLPPFFSIENPIISLREDHITEGQRFKRIAALTNNYTPPVESCTTYKAAFAMLEEFDKDLKKHIHMENNILFPKAIELEKTFEKVS
ncbi:iron-sulfur cluster repair di-iron protein [Flavobacterium quisquiliarum]|uniref:Iron-sulfur cluster repair di-iron protein n=1 Tax=Flavobacterium quisquiliarum TaxID=1834436 RepID=A0ABV8W5D8_9FLAO|nr:iron-sulfur cluster repair di-iron protein [Flavobacterium quisquiliarum]MBW1654306.1 iron-sulfur cluster repair di-iron protein [Flavobacterium quisquiliarum]NWL03349.1 iron-sulfur cluster repair di-iron protein [Flavobacterium collinsii]